MRLSMFRLLIAGFILVSMAVSATAQTGGQIQLEKKFFKGMQYSYDGQEFQSVFTFTGMSFEPHFKDVLSQHPEALQEAKKSFAYNGLALLGSITMLVGSGLMLANTLEDAQDVSNDRFPDNSYDYTPLILVIGGVITTVVGSMLANNKLKKGVNIFNNKQNLTSLKQKKSNINFSIGPKILYSRPGLGLSISWN